MENEYEFWQKCGQGMEKENGDIDDYDKEIKVLLYTVKKAYEKGKNDKTEDVRKILQGGESIKYESSVVMKFETRVSKRIKRRKKLERILNEKQNENSIN